MKAYRVYFVLVHLLIMFSLASTEQVDKVTAQTRLRNNRKEDFTKDKRRLAYTFLKAEEIDASLYDGNHEKTVGLLDKNNKYLVRLSALYLMFVNEGQKSIPFIWDYFQEEREDIPVDGQRIPAAEMLLELGDVRWKPTLQEEYRRLTNETNISLFLKDPAAPNIGRISSDISKALDLAILFARSGDGRGYELAERFYDNDLSFRHKITLLLGEIELYVPESVKNENNYHPIELLKSQAQKEKETGNVQTLLWVVSKYLTRDQANEVCNAVLQNPDIDEKLKGYFRVSKKEN